MRELHVVGTPSVHKLSLIARGIPVSGFVFRHPLSFWSKTSACADADSFVCVTKALTFASTWQIRKKYAHTISVAVTSPAVNFFCRSQSVRLYSDIRGSFF
jgi:hypothetical protein